MKKIHFLLPFFFAGIAAAEFQTWTNKEGKAVELELISKTEKNGELVGTFRMKNGRSVDVTADTLSAESAAALKAWEAKEESTEDAAANSVYDDILDGNLEQLSGKRLKRASEFIPPKKKYVFYYTASWCGPCQKFTPQLVDFYKKNKDENFEVILITSDSDEDAMEKYAVDKAMPWPQLKLRKASDFKKKFPNKLRGIPYIMVADLEGEIIAEGNAYSILPSLKKHLAD